MKKVHRDELKLVKKITEMPSIEVDLASVTDGIKEIKEKLKETLKKYALRKPKSRATLYYLTNDSVNFTRPTYSVFIGVAGDKKLLDTVYSLFYKKNLDAVRESDYISPEQSKRFMHIQEGNLWTPNGYGYWICQSESEEIAKLKDSAPASSEQVPQNPLFDQNASLEKMDAVILAKDALALDTDTVKFTKHRIENLLGLPAGSILICGPNHELLRGNTTIRKLKTLWK